jgi:hypothetical protein
MWKIAKKLLRDQRGFFRSSGYTPPPADYSKEDEQKAAEEAAAKERENLKKKKRPTLLTGAAGVTEGADLYRPQLLAAQAGKKTLG